MHLVSEVPQVVSEAKSRTAKGLRERMKAAANVRELNDLRTQSKLFVQASEATRRRWQNTYNKRLQELST